MLRYPAVLDDGLLDVSYVMNYPGEQVPTLLRELMRGREESDTLEIMDCFGSMRVEWLEVHCADGLQASCCGSRACTHAYVSVQMDCTQALAIHVHMHVVLRRWATCKLLHSCAMRMFLRRGPRQAFAIQVHMHMFLRRWAKGKRLRFMD